MRVCIYLYMWNTIAMIYYTYAYRPATDGFQMPDVR